MAVPPPLTIRTELRRRGLNPTIRMNQFLQIHSLEQGRQVRLIHQVEGSQLFGLTRGANGQVGGGVGDDACGVSRGPLHAIEGSTSEAGGEQTFRTLPAICVHGGEPYHSRSYPADARGDRECLPASRQTRTGSPAR